MDIIDIGDNDIEPVSIKIGENDKTPSVNFGNGIELLMNDKKIIRFGNVDLGDLDDLEVS